MQGDWAGRRAAGLRSVGQLLLPRAGSGRVGGAHGKGMGKVGPKGREGERAGGGRDGLQREPL